MHTRCCTQSLVTYLNACLQHHSTDSSATFSLFLTLCSSLDAACVQEDAAQLSIPNYWPALLQQEGGVGLNATTSQDETRYFVSLPSNKLELWFALESRRFQACSNCPRGGGVGWVGEAGILQAG